MIYRQIDMDLCTVAFINLYIFKHYVNIIGKVKAWKIAGPVHPVQNEFKLSPS